MLTKVAEAIWHGSPAQSDSPAFAPHRISLRLAARLLREGGARSRAGGGQTRRSGSDDQQDGKPRKAATAGSRGRKPMGEGLPHPIEPSRRRQRVTVAAAFWKRCAFGDPAPDSPLRGYASVEFRRPRASARGYTRPQLRCSIRKACRQRLVG